MSFRYERWQIDFGDVEQLQWDMEETWDWEDHKKYIRKRLSEFGNHAIGGTLKWRPWDWEVDEINKKWDELHRDDPDYIPPLQTKRPTWRATGWGGVLKLRLNHFFPNELVKPQNVEWRLWYWLSPDYTRKKNYLLDKYGLHMS